MLAQLTNVSLSFPDKKVLDEVSLTVYPGDRIGHLEQDFTELESISDLVCMEAALESFEHLLKLERRIFVDTLATERLELETS